MTRASVSLLIALTLGACDDDDGDETLNDYLEDGEMHVDGLRAEIESHHDDAQRAENLAQLQDLEQSHEDAAHHHLGELDQARGDMENCHGPSEHWGSMDHMQDMCDGELQQHHDRIRDCETMDQAMQEEKRHRDMMMEHLGGLDETMHGMRDKHGHSMCGHDG